jgi:choline-sulfatase
MDEQIGRILDALEASGRSENTWIFFTADHGLGMGRHGLAGKQNMYEHSMRVPFIVSGPGVSSGAVLDTPIYFQDVVPTTLELAKADASTEMDFKSLMPILNGGDGQEHYPAIYGAYLDRQRMIRIGDWKLIHYPGIGVERFFNIKEDPLEMRDLARPDLSHPNVPTRKQQAMQEKLRRSLVALGRDMDDPLLTAVEDGE